MRISKAKLRPFFTKKMSLIKTLERTYRFRRIGRKNYMRHWVLNNNAPILLVAHIDTVQKPKLVTYKTGMGFDDRLGVYLAVTLAQQYPQYFDCLLTDYEEKGRSTAKYFVPTKDYSWIVQLDREGSDFVHYYTATNEFCQLWINCGIRSGFGSYSDIAELDHVDCSKINLGIGVYNSHKTNSGFHPNSCHRAINTLLYIAEWHNACHYRSPTEGHLFSDVDIPYCEHCLTYVQVLGDLTYCHRYDMLLCARCARLYTIR